MEYSVTDPPMLDTDGVTILQRAGGCTKDGVFFDSVLRFSPGEPGYDELLPEARRNPVPASPPAPTRKPDPATLARLRGAMPDPE